MIQPAMILNLVAATVFGSVGKGCSSCPDNSISFFFPMFQFNFQILDVMNNLSSHVMDGSCCKRKHSTLASFSVVSLPCQEVEGISCGTTFFFFFSRSVCKLWLRDTSICLERRFTDLIACIGVEVEFQKKYNYVS